MCIRDSGMAALYALGIDNCLIQVNGPEFPILDGSAQYYVQEIERVGTVEQNAVKDFYIIKSKIEFRDETTGSSIIVLPDENFSLNAVSYTHLDVYKRQRYMMRGVSASKEDVHNAIKNIDKGIFPKAFCKIIPDILGGDPEYCNIMHADGAGTKSSLAYMYWKETGDLSVWKGIAPVSYTHLDVYKRQQSSSTVLP